jgi:hypothetical protein
LGIDVVVGKLVSLCTHAIYGDHYLVTTFLADSFQGQIINKEPDKHTQWQWFDINHLPDKLLITTQFALSDYQNQVVYQKRSSTTTQLLKK